MWHRPTLRYAEDDWSKGLWVLMGLTMMFFLQASTTDPGWLRPKPCAFSNPGGCLLGPCSLIFWVCRCCGRRPARQPHVAEASSMGSASREGEQSAGSDP